MTGYAERKFENPRWAGKISIKTLNHRFFDWSYRGTQIGGIENKLRTLCQKRLHRGRVEVSLDLHFLDSSRWDVWFNEDLMKKVVSSIKRIHSDKKIPLNFSVDSVFSIPHAVEIRRRDLTRKESTFLEQQFERTLEDLIKTRRREGRQLRQEIQACARRIQQAIQRLDKRADRHPLTIQKKLEQRLKELNAETALSEERIAEETAYIAQRYDLTEEVVRLKYHLNHLNELISTDSQEAVGKKLDFVAQELYREANTINSKAQDMEIIKHSLTIKSEIESIRQQVQNIE